jgi:DNA-binding transcriptional MerR regulator
MVSSAARRGRPDEGQGEPARGHSSGSRGASSMNIWSVLSLLRPDFPDVSISKIRFLEEQGLVEPERTPAGYRKFSHADVERLRYVLGVQRDHYLPLRVIRDHLTALDNGLEPPVAGGPRSPRLVTSNPDGSSEPVPVIGHGEQRLTREKVCELAGVSDDLLQALESFGLVVPSPAGSFDSGVLVVARTAGELAAFGIEPRHLRAFRGAADREAGLVEQVVRPLRGQRDAEAAARAEETTREVSGLCVQLHAALVKAALERDRP